MPTRSPCRSELFTKELIILEDMTLPPDLVTRFVVSITPFAPSVSTFSWPFGRLEVLLTVLNAYPYQTLPTEAPARSILMTVFHHQHPKTGKRCSCRYRLHVGEMHAGEPRVLPR